MGMKSLTTTEPVLASATLNEKLEKMRLALARALRYSVALNVHCICSEPSLSGHGETCLGWKFGSKCSQTQLVVYI